MVGWLVPFPKKPEKVKDELSKERMENVKNHAKDYCIDLDEI